MIDNRLMTLITLAKYRNYTKTAEHLNLTQPAVTQHIQYLEDYYGVDLVARHRGQLHLTAEGEVLLEFANKVKCLAIGVKRALDNRTSIIRKYQIGATLTIGEYVLPAILGRHKQIHPNIDISMSVQNTDTLMERLDNGELDLGVVEGPFNQLKYEHRLLKKDSLVLVVSSEHRLAGRHMVEPEELFQEKLIVREEGSGTRAFFEDNMRKRGYTLQDFDSCMEIGNLNAIRTLVLSNLGISVISREVVRKEIAENSLCSIPIKDMDLEREFRFVYLRDSLAREFIEGFIDFCLEHISES